VFFIAKAKANIVRIEEIDIRRKEEVLFKHYIFLKMGILLFAYYVRRIQCPVTLRAVSFTISKS